MLRKLTLFVAAAAAALGACTVGAAPHPQPTGYGYYGSDPYGYRTGPTVHHPPPQGHHGYGGGPPAHRPPAHHRPAHRGHHPPPH